MKKMLQLALFTLLAGMLVIGCSQNSETDIGLLHNSGIANLILPSGAVLQSATLHLYIETRSMETVEVHRVTSPWNEMTVTWNSFGGAFDATTESSFAADVWGWRSADITGLVQGWLDGSYANYGLLIKQGDKSTPLTVFYSRENNSAIPLTAIPSANRPK